MPKDDEQPAAPSLAKLVAGYLAVALLLVMFVMALFGDIFVWAVWGTRFVLSPSFHRAEFWLNSLLAFSFFSFIGLDKGLEHFQQRRWKPFLFALLTFIVATLPFAKPSALLIRLATIRGLAALAQPKVMLFIALVMLVFFCKCRIMFSLWRLLRPSQPRETRRIVVSE